jgi:hypothetical protein
MRAATALATALLLCGLAGCGREHTLACEATARYASATSAPPVQIPDDLSPPDETNSLHLPPEGGTTAALTRPCLESPPGFYADGAPGGTRLGNPPARPAPATAPAPAAPEPAVPPVDDPNRQIGN